MRQNRIGKAYIILHQYFLSPDPNAGRFKASRVANKLPIINVVSPRIYPWATMLLGDISLLYTGDIQILIPPHIPQINLPR